MSVVIANAPCSYGAFEITIGVYPNVPDPVTLLDGVSEAGYAGIDLGPVGYLGIGEELAKRLSERELSLAGGYLGLPFTDPAALAQEMGRVDELLDVFDLTAGGDGPPPRPTLADAGAEVRFENPGGAATDRTLGLGESGWKRFADGLARVVDRCRERGYEPTFHHHTATYVEAVWEIERVMELSDVGICLDTGHLLIGGGDPVTALRDWAGRINHLHVKDARREVVEGIVRERAPFQEIWERRAFCVLGEGDIDLEGVLATIDEIGYSGWLVVEQDIFPDPLDDQHCFVDQALNRAYLREHGL